MSNIENSKLKLLEHQEDAYEKVEELFKKDKYAAVIFPTGCGKSFVTLKYILEHPNEKILFLSPRCAIKEQMYEYIVRYIGGRTKDSIEDIKKEFGSMEDAAQSFIPGIKAMLYQTVLQIGEKESLDDYIKSMNPDLIVIDEMHHLKTKRNRSNNYIEEDEENLTQEEVDELRRDENEWGKKFNKLLEMCPNAKVLGLSATPIRTDGANVVERIFEGSIASEITLLEAMEEGIIIPPKYIVPDFIRKDELDTLLEQIEQAEGERKDELKRKYDELVEKSSHVQGIPELLQECITEKKGKYIVFCKDISDMEEKQKLAGEWFGKIDEEATIYRISSKHSDSQKQLELFNTDTSDHLKIMYCIGMIDEGVHLNDVSGVILAAKTGSRPTYLQRLGRAISSGSSKRQALVIDLVNNNEILYKDVCKDKNYAISDLETIAGLIEWINEKNNGELPDFENFKTNKEKVMFLRLKRLNNKYFKYIENEELLEKLDESKKKEIEEILMLGEEISLWDEYIKEGDENERKSTNCNLDNFLKDIKIKGIRIEFQELLEDINYKKSAYEEIIEYLEKNGTMPKSSFKENGKVKKKNEMTEDEKYQVNLYARWRRAEEYKILKEYEGKDIEEVPKEYREKIEKLRSFGLGIKEKSTYEEIIEYLEKNNGKMPQGNFSKDGKAKTRAEMTEDEKYQRNLYARWTTTKEYKILKKYAGKDIEEVPKEYKEKIEKLRSFGLGIKEKSTYEEIIEYLEKNGTMPKSSFFKDGEAKKRNEMTEDEIYQVNLYGRWIETEEYKILKEYEGKDIEELPEEYREKIAKLRSLIKEKSAYEEIIEYLEKNGTMPKSSFTEHGKVKKKNEMTEDEKYQVNLYARWRMAEEYKILKEYAGKDIEEVPKEYKEKIEKLRSFGIGVHKKDRLKEAKEERDSAKKQNEETKKLEIEVQKEFDKMKGRTNEEQE